MRFHFARLIAIAFLVLTGVHFAAAQSNAPAVTAMYPNAAAAARTMPLAPIMPASTINVRVTNRCPLARQTREQLARLSIAKHLHLRLCPPEPVCPRQHFRLLRLPELA